MNKQHYIDGFKRHLRILQALADITFNVYRRKVEEFISWYEDTRKKEIQFETITRQDVEAYIEWCFYKGNGNQTRFTKLIALQKFFRYLVYDGILKEDVTALIPRPRIFKKFVQKFSHDEVLRIFKQIDIFDEHGLRDVVLLIMGFFCGMRSGEIINCKVGDIVDDGSVIDINIPETKRHSSRTIYLWKVPSVIVRKFLTVRLSQGAKANSPFLISCQSYGDKEKRLTSLIPNRVIKKYSKMAGIRKARVHIHMCRATHASDLRYIRGYDIAAIAERLGHIQISSTDRYLPSRARIHREYPSLAVYWKEFAHLWSEKKEDVKKTEETKPVQEGTPQAVQAAV